MTPEPPAPAGKPDRSALLAVVAVALAASLAGLGNDFAQDDSHLIQLNTRLHSLANWPELLLSPFWPPPYSQDLYRPLTSLLLAIQYQLGAGMPLVYRVVSYGLYAAASAGVFLLGRRILPRALALGAALLFAAHPVHVEAVALGVGQSELVVAILTILASIRYLDRRRAGALGGRDWAALGGLYLAAGLTKEHGLILPGLLLAAEAFLVPGTVRSKVPLLWRGYALLAGLGGVLLLLRRAVLGGEIAGTFTAEALQGVGWGGRTLTLLQIVPQWLRLLAWPARLRSDYSPQEFVASSGFGAVEALGLALLLGAATVAWLGRRKAPVPGFGLAWCALALLPVSNLLIPTGVLIAERTLFLPSVGFLLAAAGGVEWVARGRWAAARPGLVRGVGLAVAALALAGILRSAERHRVWRNEAFLAARSVQDAPRSFRTQRAYGSVLFQLGQRELALEAYRRASELAPRGNAWQVRNDLARWFRETGQPGPEAEQLRASLEDRPEQEDVRAYLVAAYLALGAYEDAASEADSALARGGNQQVFSGLRSLADSAARSGAPPGTVRIRIGTVPGLPIR